MRYGSISLVLMCLLSSNAFASLKVINQEEQAAFRQIENKYDIDSQLIAVNDKFSTLNKRYYDIQEIKEKIEANKVDYQKLISQLPDKILAKVEMGGFYEKIETNVNETADLTLKEKIDTAALERQNLLIQEEYESVNKLRIDKSQQLFELKTDIINRLIADLSKSSSNFPVNIDGSTKCSKYQSISDCLKESKNSILTTTRNESPFLNDKSVLLSYEVIDANMNMAGDLRYKVAMNFKPSYNSKIDTMLNERLGLRSAMVTLVSNVPADWYVNGKKIGTGTKLFHEMPLGKHGILASYHNSEKSSVEKIEGNGVFNYNFKTTTESKVAKKPNGVERLSPIETPKGSIKPKAPKAKFTLLADSTTVPTPVKEQSETPKAPEEAKKGYEYFIGITPPSKKQDIEFTNEPLNK
ncbi:hypothetical protein [Shewanella youngdeokensis]|uniref:PEGA domain-containing protein n=1 Tax=Shewanella youngdeokensis TaxID=2999068 RepID=A0ABZ0K0M8_9GAMM|nr:hypothetical protein RGE70_04685 [Shewanella sp. DAU334]